MMNDPSQPPTAEWSLPSTPVADFRRSLLDLLGYEAGELARRKRIAEDIEAAVQKTRDYIKFGHVKKNDE